MTITKVGSTEMTPLVASVANLVLSIAQRLVDDEDAVEIEVRTGEKRTILCIRVAEMDTGKVIGKQGRTAESIRVILSSVGVRLKHRFSLEIFQAPPQ